MRVLLVSVVALLLVASAVCAQALPELPAGTITKIRGELYRVDVGDRVTVFLVTADGILLADPLDRASATWLKAQLAERFPKTPVKYVIHTAHAFDRAEGASVFRDTAEAVSQQSFEASASDARRQLEPAVAALDRNGDKVLDAAEMNGPAATLLLPHDRDNDGRVTSGELYAFVVAPRHTFSQRETLMLGRRPIELVYPGPAFGEESAAILFPAERVVFVNRQPGIRGPLFDGVRDPSDLKRWVRTMASLDADLIVTGRGEVTDRREVAALAPYLDDLVRSIVAASELGRPAEDIPRSPSLDRHTGAPYDSQRAANIAALRRSVTVFRLGVHATGAVNAARSGSDYCGDQYTQCERPQMVAGTTAGVMLSWGRIAAVAEMMVAPQLIQWRTSTLFDDAIAHRETTVTVLAGYTSPPARRLSFSALGGFSYVVSDLAYVSRRRFTLVSSGLAGGTFTNRQSSLGMTGAGEVALKLADRLAIVAPVRLTRATGNESAFWPGSVFVQGGVGLRYRLYRSGP